MMAIMMRRNTILLFFFSSSFFTIQPHHADAFAVHHHCQHKPNFRRIKRRIGQLLPLKALVNAPDDDDEGDEIMQTTKETTMGKNTDATSIDSKLQSSSLSPPSPSWDSLSRQFKLFTQMATTYYKESDEGKWMLASVIGLTLLNSAVSVQFSYLSRDFWNALSASQPEQFQIVLLKFVAALAIGAPIITYYRYQRAQLAVHWREWMTARTFNLYVQNKVYYNLVVASQQQQDTTLNGQEGQGQTQNHKLVDNPDQRIQEDVNSFTTYSLQLVITALTSIIDLCSFSAILWSIYPALFAAIIAYALFGTVVTTWLGQTLVQLNFQQLTAEANLRYSLVRLRDNAESIAFYSGEDLEGQLVEQMLENVMDNRRRINVAHRNLEFFTTAYRYLVQILPLAVVAPKFFAKEIELGVISQAVGAFNHILSDVSIFVNQFESLSAFSAGMERLSGFYHAMQDADEQRNATTGGLLEGVVKAMNKANTTTSSSHSSEPIASSLAPSSSSSSVIMANGNCQPGEQQQQLNGATSSSLDKNKIQLSFSKNPNDPHILSIYNLDLCTPDRRRTLISNLHLQLKEGENLLIVGNSGSGKSSLLRAIAGLWKTGNGTITRPHDDDVYFLPQRPYCTVGSLKDQLLYPSLDHLMSEEAEEDENRIVPRAHWLKQSLSDDDLLDVLDKVDLLDLAVRSGGDEGNATAGLYVKQDWGSILSLGEQQRLAFGRVLVNQPRFLIVDEATSALDIEAEARMYGLLKQQQQQQQQLTYVSVGHRPSLLSFHDKRLKLNGVVETDGACFDLSDIKKEQARPTSSAVTATTDEVRSI